MKKSRSNPNSTPTPAQTSSPTSISNSTPVAIPAQTPESLATSPKADGIIVAKRRRHPIRKAILTLLVLLLVLATALAALAWTTVKQNIHQFDPTATLEAPYDLPADTLSRPLPAISGVTNILLLGVDNRNADSNSIRERSDAMMILTLDGNQGQIKLTSLQRDMSVYFPGENKTRKINAANAVGGPLLAMRVVNDTFRLDIDKFVVVNMAGLEQIIDAAGGVEIDVSEKERLAVNEELAMVNQTFPDTEPSPILEAAGAQQLNGRQAVTYARIRKIDSDYHRMERQRELMQALFTAALTASPTEQYQLAKTGLSNITTNLTVAELAWVGLRSVLMLTQPIAQLQIPIEGYYNNVSGEVWRSLCDFNGMIPLLQDFIYGQTFPFDPVRVIEGAPNN